MIACQSTMRRISSPRRAFHDSGLSNLQLAQCLTIFPLDAWIQIGSCLAMTSQLKPGAPLLCCMQELPRAALPSKATFYESADTWPYFRSSPCLLQAAQLPCLPAHILLKKKRTANRYLSIGVLYMYRPDLRRSKRGSGNDSSLLFNCICPHGHLWTQ